MLHRLICFHWSFFVTSLPKAELSLLFNSDSHRRLNGGRQPCSLSLSFVVWTEPSSSGKPQEDTAGQVVYSLWPFTLCRILNTETSSCFCYLPFICSLFLKQSLTREATNLLVEFVNLQACTDTTRSTPPLSVLMSSTLCLSSSPDWRKCTKHRSDLRPSLSISTVWILLFLYISRFYLPWNIDILSQDHNSNNVIQIRSEWNIYLVSCSIAKVWPLKFLSRFSSCVLLLSTTWGLIISEISTILYETFGTCLSTAMLKFICSKIPRGGRPNQHWTHKLIVSS